MPTYRVDAACVSLNLGALVQPVVKAVRALHAVACSAAWHHVALDVARLVVNAVQADDVVDLSLLPSFHISDLD